jgi:hypothetical protein
MPRLRQEQREQAIGRLNAGQRPLLVAQEINCNVYSTNDRVRAESVVPMIWKKMAPHAVSEHCLSRKCIIDFHLRRLYLATADDFNVAIVHCRQGCVLWRTTISNVV